MQKGYSMKKTSKFYYLNLIVITLVFIIPKLSDLRNKRNEDLLPAKIGSFDRSANKNDSLIASSYELTTMPGPLELNRDNSVEAEYRFGKMFTERIKKSPETFAFNYISDSATEIVYLGVNALSGGHPRLLLSFKKPDHAGSLIPCMISHISTVLPFEFINDQRQNTMLYHKEMTSAILKSRIFNSQESSTGELPPDGEPQYTEGGYGLSVLLAESRLTMEHYDYLIMGRTYGMTLGIPISESEGGGTEWRMVMMRVPENVPPGQTAVLEIDVTREYDYLTVATEKPVRHKLNLQFREPLPPGQILAGVTRPGEPLPGEGFHQLEIGADGVGHEFVNELGGELMIVVHGEMKVEMLYYIRRVNRTDLVFPDHAEIAVDYGKMVEFKLEIPGSKVPGKLAAMVLLLDQDPPLPVAWGLVSDDPRAGGRAEGEAAGPETVAMSSVPGSYHVGYMTIEGEEIIGRIDIRAEDQGRTLAVLLPEKRVKSNCRF